MAGDGNEGEMWQAAFQLAVSGKFADTDAVVTELRSRGFTDVETLANSKFAREQITAMCQNARRAKEDERAEKQRQPNGR